MSGGEVGRGGDKRNDERREGRKGEKGRERGEMSEGDVVERR